MSCRSFETTRVCIGVLIINNTRGGATHTLSHVVPLPPSQAIFHVRKIRSSGIKPPSRPPQQAAWPWDQRPAL